MSAEVTELQSWLSALAKSQAEMDQARGEEKAAYSEAKTDLETGLTGVRKALTMLRDYYGSAAMVQTDSDSGDWMHQPAPPASHVKSADAGGNIIDLLEVMESDFANNLAKVEKTESDAVAEYETTSEDNKMSKMTKEQDVHYKTAAMKNLNKIVSEVSNDRSTETARLAAVNDYLAKLKERCVGKPEAFEERKKRREAEITGLKEALDVLQSEAALLQHHKRGLRRH